MKIRIIIATVLLFTSAATAQLDLADLEAYIGANCACLGGEEESSESLLCPEGGVAVTLLNFDELSLSSGVRFIGSGGMETYSYDEGDFSEGGLGKTSAASIETRQSLRYLQIPAMASYTLGQGRFRPFFRTGAALGILLSAHNTVTSDFNGQEEETETDVKNEFSSTNVVFSFGGGVSFPLGGVRGNLSVDYGLGLTNIAEGEFARQTKTRDVMFRLGITL